MERRWLSGAVAFLLCAPAVAQDRALDVSVSAAIATPIRAIAKEFEQFKPGSRITISVQSEDTPLANHQVLIGPFESMPTGVKGRMFARDPIVVATASKDSKVSKFAHIASNISVTWPSADTLVGRHVQQVIQMAGDSYGKDWQANVQRNVKSVAKTSKDAITQLQNAKVDAVLTALSDAHAAGPGIGTIFLPVELGSAIEYFACVKPGSSRLADAFIEYLYTPGNQLRLEAAGFLSPLRPPPELLISKPSGMMHLFTSALGTHPKQTIRAKDAKGAVKPVAGISVESLLAGDAGTTVTFYSADGTSQILPLSEVKRKGAVIVPMPGGNYQVVFGKAAFSERVRWLRRIELK